MNRIIGYLLRNPSRDLDPLFLGKMLDGFNSLFDR